jgi:hypothetical protein
MKYRARAGSSGLAALAALVLALPPSGPMGSRAGAQTPPAGTPPAVPTAAPSAGASGGPTPAATPPGPAPAPQPASPEAPAAESPAAAPTPTPTQPPIIVDPPAAGVNPGATLNLRLIQVLGTVTVTVADPSIADAAVDQRTRTLTVTGKALGSTVVTVKDERGLTRDVPVRVADNAGTIAASAEVRITGNPATTQFIAEQATRAARKAASVRPGATVAVTTDSVSVREPLAPDDVTLVDVPVILSGGDRYFSVSGTTTVRVENFAEPDVPPQSLLVSDFPETLKANGVLFTADLNARQAERFLYYHYNPAGQPDRHIVLRVANAAPEPALLQFISGRGGPDVNEMLVGHMSTERFLVRRAQNEGTVLQIPGNSTLTLVDQPLPAGNVVSNLLQLHEIAGPGLHLTLLALDSSDAGGAPLADSALLVGDVPHARGIYPIPEFFFDFTYDTDGPDLEVPIGQIPLPNLVQGETLAGDYGVLQSVRVQIVNNDRHNARQIALYANPRGGRATGTFIIDGVLVQAHQMAPFGHYKLRQYTIPPGSFVRTDVVTMPEGGSSYPLRLVLAPDDGSAAPGSPESPVY